MGRTRGSFVLPGMAPPSVMATVIQFASDKKFKAAWTAPNQLVLWRGREEHDVGRRILVTVFDGPPGTTVQIEAWIEAILGGEQDASPRSIVNGLPRWQLWKTVTKLLDALGAPGAAAGFQHSG